jgi:hypothetical protein
MKPTDAFRIPAVLVSMAAAVLCAAPTLAAGAGDQAAAAPAILHVGKTRPLRTIGEAARTARDGDTVEIDAGDYVGDVAVWTQDRLTIRAPNGRAHLIANGASAEGKGIWVMRGRAILVENIDLTGAKVADGNGAGIRFEKGQVTIRNCTFTENENGILSGNNSGALVIENSEFEHNGTVNGQGHSIYVGRIQSLRMSGTYVHRAAGGHLVKSRAAENHLEGNRLTDEIGGMASYELEFPDGGVNYVIGNIIEQASTTENSTIVSVGSEGYRWPRNELYFVNNTVADDKPQGGIYVTVRPGIQRVKAVNNIFVGSGRLETGGAGELVACSGLCIDDIKQSVRGLVKSVVAHKSDADGPASAAGSAPAPIRGEFANNFRADWDQFVLAARYDYRLAAGARLNGKATVAGTARGVDLTQRLQYVHPHSVRTLQTAPEMPGAVQDGAR